MLCALRPAASEPARGKFDAGVNYRLNRSRGQVRMRAVVVGASSGLGRCIGIGLGQRGAQVALLARRRDRLEAATAEAGPGAVGIECDVTEQASVTSAIAKAAAELGGIDALVYTPAIGP